MNNKQDMNEWLSYDIVPAQVKAKLRPATWGNGQLEILAELDRPCVSEALCFGFGPHALASVRQEHLIPAVYDADTGRKYYLSSFAVPKAAVTFRPDRQVWRYEFDDLTVLVSLILPRVCPGYFFKLELIPQQNNKTRQWYVYHETRAFHGNVLRATKPSCDPTKGAVWWSSTVGAEYSTTEGDGQAIGSNVEADNINVGLDGELATDIMVKLAVRQDADAKSSVVYLARAFGDIKDTAKRNLDALLSSPEELEKQSEEWWNRYLKEVPRLEIPDEGFAKNFLWSWANFRMNKIEFPIGKSPYPGLFAANNLILDKYGSIACGDHFEVEAVEVLHDPTTARNLMFSLLTAMRKRGLLSTGFMGLQEYKRCNVFSLGWLCGLLHKYLLTSGDMGLLAEDIGGLKFLERLEDGLEAQIALMDDKTGLVPVDAETSGGLAPCMESITRYRDVGAFWSEQNGMMYGTLLVMADIEDLIQNTDRSKRYYELADELREVIRNRLWNDDLGYFSDLKVDGSFGDYLGIGGLITGLNANHVYRPGGAATPEQAKELAKWVDHPDFATDFGVLSLARSSPYYDAFDYKGFSGGIDMHFCNLIAGGLYAHGCYKEAHEQLNKLFRRLGENAGLGPRYRGEAYSENGEILPWRSANYPCELTALSAVIEGAFGLRWTRESLNVDAHLPWPKGRLMNLRIRNSMLDLELLEDGCLRVAVDGETVMTSSDGKAELGWELFEH